MNLETTLMGLNIKNPIMVGSSSLTNSLKNVKKCEAAGAGAIVLKSLYEEQIIANTDQLVRQDDMYQWFPEAMDFVKTISKKDGIEKYLELVKDCKDNVDIPVIASINCFSSNEWTKFARELELAGADAIELNISIIPESEKINSEKIEDEYFQIVKSIKKITDIPLSVKVSSFFTNIRLAAHNFKEAGASSLVLFSRFYRPDIDIDSLQMTTRDTLSGPEEITHPLRWIGLLSSHLNCDLVASTGIHDATGVIKQILAGAVATQVCTALYENGISYINDLLNDVTAWMKMKDYDSITDFRGLINKDPQNCMSWERLHFMKKTAGNIIKPIFMN